MDVSEGKGEAVAVVVMLNVGKLVGVDSITGVLVHAESKQAIDAKIVLRMKATIILVPVSNLQQSLCTRRLVKL